MQSKVTNVLKRASQTSSSLDSTVDAPLSHSNPLFIDGLDPLTETFLNPENAFFPYPSPPANPTIPLNPTPPENTKATNCSTDTHANDEDIVVSVSTSFNPKSHSTTPDMIFMTFDRVLFYTHSQLLKIISPNPFGKIIHDDNLTNDASESGNIYHIPDSSSVFNVILHTLYGSSPAHNTPTFETLMLAIDRMQFYNIDPRDFITTQTPIYQLLLSYTPLYPLHLYSLAGHHGLEDLAVSSSSHLLSFPMMTLPDEMAVRMGAVYLKRLFCLHLGRTNALKENLLASPHPHAPTKECNFTEQKALTRAWALASAYLVWDARADFSTASLRKAFESLADNLTCSLCQSGLEKRIKEVVSLWATVKPTI